MIYDNTKLRAAIAAWMEACCFLSFGETYCGDLQDDFEDFCSETGMMKRSLAAYVMSVFFVALCVGCGDDGDSGGIIEPEKGIGSGTVIGPEWIAIDVRAEGQGEGAVLERGSDRYGVAGQGDGAAEYRYEVETNWNP